MRTNPAVTALSGYRCSVGGQGGRLWCGVTSHSFVERLVPLDVDVLSAVFNSNMCVERRTKVPWRSIRLRPVLRVITKWLEVRETHPPMTLDWLRARVVPVYGRLRTTLYARRRQRSTCKIPFNSVCEIRAA